MPSSSECPLAMIMSRLCAFFAVVLNLPNAKTL
ncbi:hypothetical protein T09_1400 [Trichinella sp. T9]|nr:hypothetical protein T09_1400 [Trichinella sp. T9]